MSSIFNKLEATFAPPTVVARQRPEIFLPSGETTVLPFDQPDEMGQAGAPAITPKPRSTVASNSPPPTNMTEIAPAAPPAGAGGRTLAGGSQKAPVATMQPGSNVALPTRSGAINVAEGLPPVGDPFALDISATPDDSLNHRRVRSAAYEAWRSRVLDNLPDIDPGPGGPEYDSPRFAELPSNWSHATKVKAIRFLRRAGAD